MTPRIFSAGLLALSLVTASAAFASSAGALQNRPALRTTTAGSRHHHHHHRKPANAASRAGARKQHQGKS
jgi:hypothetical protein